MREKVRQALMHLCLWKLEDLVLPDMNGMKKKDQARIAKGDVLFESLYIFQVQSDSDPSRYHTVEHDGIQSLYCSCKDLYKWNYTGQCKHMNRVDLCLLQRRERLGYLDPIYTKSPVEQDIAVDPAQRGHLSSAAGKGFSLLR